MRARSIALVLAVAGCAAVPVALAASVRPKARALYGGGAIGPTFTRGNHSDVTWASVRVAKDARSVTVYLDVDVTCGVARGVVLSTGSAPLRAGRFAGTSTIDATQNGGVGGTVKFAGRFASLGAASGTATVSATRAGSPCTARTVSWQARNTAATRTRPKARPGGAYYGNTAQTYPVLLRLAPGGRQLRQASLEFDYGCQSATQRGFSDETTPAAKVSRTGAFSGTDTYATPLGPGLTGHWLSTVRGRVRANRITGVWKVDLTITRDSDGSMADFCTTGHVSFSAVR